MGGILSKDRLIFDPADMTESDQVGAYLIGAGGTVIGNTGDALKVDVTAITAVDLDIRDLDAAQDNVAISDGTDTLQINNDGSISAVVSATDLDIRDLTHVSDSIRIGDGTNLATVNADGSFNVNLTDDGVADDAADTGNPFKVGGVAYASALSAVSAGDRVNMAMDLYRRQRVFVGAQVGILTPAVVAVGTSAVALPASPLAGRQKIIVQNTSNNDIYVGDSGVTTSTGIRIAKGATLELDIGEIVLYGIAGSAGNNVRVLEVA